MNKITTTDLAKFGFRELKLARDLLDALIEQGLPEDFEDNEVAIMFNTHSGYVFLTNANYQAAIMNDDTLESYYTLPYSGKEGFKEDFEGAKRKDYANEDWTYIQKVILNK